MSIEVKSNRGVLQDKSLEALKEELIITEGSFFELKLSKSRGIEGGFHSKYKIFKKNITRLTHLIEEREKREKILKIFNNLSDKYLDLDEKNDLSENINENRDGNNYNDK